MTARAGDEQSSIQDAAAQHEDLTGAIIGSCFDVANELGRGFLESVYQHVLAAALRHKGFQVTTEAPVKVFFRGQCVGNFYADLLVEGKVIVELKVCKEPIPNHRAQLINYLNASQLSVGYWSVSGRRRWTGNAAGARSHFRPQRHLTNYNPILHPKPSSLSFILLILFKSFRSSGG